MSSESRDLLARIEAFPIDGPDLPALPFAARLAREHGWSRGFAERAVREYKRFVYLAMTAGRPVCPSEQVDAVWHLHLTYTRSYWKRFCGEVLGQPLHHEPTKGGGEEADKHLRMYADTLAAYRAAFGHEPPADLWPDADTRFGSDLRHVAVNTAQNWVIPKAWVRQVAAGAGIAVVLAAGLGCGGLNPFDLKGTEFLAFLLPMLAATAAVGLLIRNTMSGPKLEPDEPLPDLNWTQTALLAGKGGRVLDAAIARLTADGVVRVSADETRLEKHGPAGDLTPIERVVYNLLPLSKADPKALKKVREEVEARAAKDEAKLQADGLVMDAGRAKTVGRLAALPYALVLVGLGGARLVMGFLHDKSVGYLVATLVIGTVVGLVLFARRLRVTHKGQAVLKQWQTRRADLKSASAVQVGHDPALAVALFGTAALAGTEYAALQRWYPRPTSGDGGCGSGCGTTSSGCGGGGGDGGGGGGGCGGCGGGGGD
jgi:uncharacterized protein (TIGR04222 family)